MINIRSNEYWNFYWSKDKNDFKETTNIFDYKWNFSLCHLPGQTIKRLNMPKNNGNDTLYIIDNDAYVIYHEEISQKIGKVYHLRFSAWNNNKKEQKVVDSIINKKPFITQQTFLKQILPYLNDFNQEKDAIYELLASKEKDSFKLGIDLLASTNWFIENKSLIHYLLTVSAYSKTLNTSNNKYILSLLHYIRPYLYDGYYNCIATLIDSIDLYKDMDWYFCRKILEQEIQKYNDFLSPIERPGRTIPKDLEEKKIQNEISTHFQGLLEIANLKIIFND